MTRPRVGRVAAAALALALASAPTVRAQASASGQPARPEQPAPDSARVALARRLLELQDAGPNIVRELEASLDAQRRSSPNIPEVFWTEFVARARRDVGQFVESLAPAYASRFTREELVQLVAFFESPIGRRLTEESPELGAAVKQEAYRWGVTLGADIAKDLAEQGVMLQ